MPKLKWANITDPDAPQDHEFEWSNPDPTIVANLWYYEDEDLWTVSIDYTVGRYSPDKQIHNLRESTTGKAVPSVRHAQEWAEEQIDDALILAAA